MKTYCLKLSSLIVAFGCFYNCAISQTPAKYYYFPEYIGANEDMAGQADQYYSFVGEYRSAVQVLDADISAYKVELAALPFTFTPLNTFISELPDSIKLLLINEAHAYAQGRVVMKQLLPDLKRKGFDCLCMEDYAHGDNSIKQYGFPTSSSGFYVNEPNYAQLIREAVNLGFKLYPIETERIVTVHTDNDGSVVKMDSITGDTLYVRYARKFVPYYSREYVNYREEDQAANVASAVKRCKKVAVLSGHGHIFKRGTMMAQILVEQYKLNPYSIDQTDLAEVRDGEINDSIVGIIRTEKAGVAMLEDKPYVGIKGADAHIALPATHYIHGRPSWLTELDNRSLQKLELPKGLTYPVMIRAYNSREYNRTKDAIPIDVFIVDSEQQAAYAALYKGINYLIVITDNKGKEQTISKKF